MSRADGGPKEHVECSLARTALSRETGKGYGAQGMQSKWQEDCLREAVFSKKMDEQDYTCAIPMRFGPDGVEVLLGLKKRGFGKGKYDGFGGKVKAGESIEDCALRELREESGLRGALVPCAEVVVLEDGSRGRHHIFIVQDVHGEPSESDEMVPEWFSLDGVPYDQMWPDIAVWLPQALQLGGELKVRGYFELAEGCLSRSWPMAPASPARALAPQVQQRLLDAIKKEGEAFDCHLRGSRPEFDSALKWTWTLLGEPRPQPSAVGPRRSYSTADAPNRMEDKRRVEQTWGVRESGDAEAELRDSDGNVVAVGYNSLVFGDHGPYFEFVHEQVCWQTFPQHLLKGPTRTHFEHYNGDGSVKLYDQFRTVKNQPNPPPGEFSTPNNRPDGYADYHVGCLYMAIDEFFAHGGSLRRRGDRPRPLLQ